MVPNRDPVGRVIAEWVMNSAARLGVKYVIWWVALCGWVGGGRKLEMLTGSMGCRGQKIWNVEVDTAPKAWTSWRAMEDRGDDTANHWYV